MKKQTRQRKIGSRNMFLGKSLGVSTEGGVLGGIGTKYLEHNEIHTIM